MKLKLFCMALLILPAAAMAACVDTVHGSICSQHEDIAQKSWGTELGLTRIYHSRYSEDGWFGHGWGTPYETRLIVMPDGTAVVRDPCCMTITRYGSYDAASLKAGVERIAAVATVRDKLDSAAAGALRTQLAANEEFRRATVLKYGLQGELLLQAKIRSPACPRSVVERIAAGYRRVSCEGEVDYFDLAGRLVRQEDKDHQVNLHYAGEHPDLIEDTLGQKIYLKWTPTGHVAEARTDKDAVVVSYRYDENDNLVLASAGEGKDTRYAYDANHKLKRVDNADGSYMAMQYDASGRLADLDEGDHSQVAYSYLSDADDPLHYWTAVKTTDANGNVTIGEAEHFLAVDSAGVERLARVIKT